MNSLLYLFGVFDTGSSVVLINDSNRDGTFSDAQTLALCRPNEPCEIPDPPNPPMPPTRPPNDGLHDRFLPLQLDVRIWGLGAVDPMTTGLPIDTPQFEAAGLQVRPYLTGQTLIGAPVAARAIAMIDYSVTVSRSFDFTPAPGRETTIEAPDITFYRPGDPMIPNAPYIFSLTSYGMFGSRASGAADGASIGPRFLMRSASITHNGRTASGSTLRILYDTGNPTTQVSETVAQALGIQLGSTPAVDRITIGTVDGRDVQMSGYQVDRFELVTADGANRFVVNKPMLYVRPNRADGSSPFPDHIDVLFGSNYLWQRRVIFNGPASTLGMFNVNPINP
jgi:hypothetical protein